MADDETKKETPETTDEDEDKEDVSGHRSYSQRPGDDNTTESREEGRPTPTKTEF